MPGSSLLPYMPTWLDRLSDATRVWDADPRLIYYELLFAHWRELCILPTDLVELQRLARVESWGRDRFRHAWEAIQGRGSWKPPKFAQDEHGFYNRAGRQFFIKALGSVVRNHKGTLKQHGCRPCREAGHRVDLGEGWVRHCPRCQYDLWDEFPAVPWFPTYLPIVGSGAAPSPPSAEEEAAMAVYRDKIAHTFMETTRQARQLTPDEAMLITTWYRTEVPAQVILDLVSARAQRQRGRPPRYLTYFAEAVSEAVSRAEEAAAAAPIRRRRNGKELEHVALAARAPIIVSDRWTALLPQLRKRLGVETFRTYFKPLGVQAETGQEIVLQYPSQHFQAVLEEHRPLLEELLAPLAVILTDGAQSASTAA